jgi:hypothetical protein
MGRNNVNKKILVFGVIALFIGLALIPSFNAVSISKFDDTTPPEIEVYYDADYNGNEWLIYFIAECSDESGINRVEFTIDDIIDETVFTEPYQSRSYRSSELNGHIFCGVAYDNYENNASECYDLRTRSLDIKSNDDCGCSDGDDYPLVLCAILWYQMFFATLLFMKTGWDVPMKILNSIGIMYNCPHFG